MTKSGLRGRGGAGFSTGMKWKFAHDSQSDQKYVICNADEGDPGAFMDRAVLEGDPHSVLEGMAIAGYAIGADKGYVYVRAEYPAGHRAPERRHRAGPRDGAAGQEHLRDRLSISTSSCAWGPAPSSAARKRRSSPRSKGSAASRGPSRPSRRSRASGASPRSSTTSRPWPTSATSSSTAGNGSPPSAPRRARAPRSSPSRAR